MILASALLIGALFMQHILKKKVLGKTNMWGGERL